MSPTQAAFRLWVKPSYTHLAAPTFFPLALLSAVFPPVSSPFQSIRVPSHLYSSILLFFNGPCALQKTDLVSDHYNCCRLGHLVSLDGLTSAILAAQVGSR
ncbi:hypothetical protein MPDQ_005791 [Monascus purpureus]|uniref:Uncharacterized protein n=1 Tax=Monascus purpureus TaxID=5098 RepID=A0A507QY32_MONPU|nr:hypothetical protein MPDQ_005791 [Monascus purpureus]